MPKNQTNQKEGQRQKFIDKARELGCYEDEACFEDELRRIAPKPKEEAPEELSGDL